MAQNDFPIILYQIPFDIKVHWMYFKEGEHYQLSGIDNELIDELLKNQIEEYNKCETLKFNIKVVDFPHLNFKLNNYTIQLENYKRQYLAVKLKEGDVLVYINCLCDVSDKKWTEELIHVEDGGKCYFRVKLNLASREVLYFRVNGEA